MARKIHSSTFLEARLRETIERIPEGERRERLQRAIEDVNRERRGLGKKRQEVEHESD
ncbi:MAG TPA: hypothetical protein PLQ01_02175 [Methanothrix sp.]|nr:hypothetical protein [Methanothrix sp.]